MQEEVEHKTDEAWEDQIVLGGLLDRAYIAADSSHRNLCVNSGDRALADEALEIRNAIYKLLRDNREVVRKLNVLLSK